MRVVNHEMRFHLRSRIKIPNKTLFKGERSLRCETQKGNPYIITAHFRSGEKMTCKMQCTLKGDNPGEMMRKLMKEAKDHGFVFDGNTRQGTFEYKGIITAKAAYERSGKNLAIEVKKKPFFISCKRIVGEVNKLLAKDLSCKETP